MTTISIIRILVSIFFLDTVSLLRIDKVRHSIYITSINNNEDDNNDDADEDDDHYKWN